MSAVETRLSLVCEQGNHATCSGSYHIGVNPVSCYCRCHFKRNSISERHGLAVVGETGAPPASTEPESAVGADAETTVERAPSTRRIFYRGQRFCLRANRARTGVLQTLQFTPEAELITLRFDDESVLPRLATYLLREVEEVLGG